MYLRSTIVLYVCLGSIIFFETRRPRPVPDFEGRRLCNACVMLVQESQQRKMLMPRFFFSSTLGVGLV
jgi:hypothetical protein